MVCIRSVFGICIAARGPRTHTHACNTQKTLPNGPHHTGPATHYAPGAKCCVNVIHMSVRLFVHLMLRSKRPGGLHHHLNDFHPSARQRTHTHTRVSLFPNRILRIVNTDTAPCASIRQACNTFVCTKGSLVCCLVSQCPSLSRDRIEFHSTELTSGAAQDAVNAVILSAVVLVASARIGAQQSAYR